MQAFVANLTAATLFIHTVLGCCWHHAHACEHGVDSTVAAQPVTCCHHQHDRDSTPHDQPCQSKVDCQGTCHFVVPQKVHVAPPHWTPIDLVAVLPSLADHQLDVTPFLTSAPPLLDAAPPLRTHLLHQVLLN